VTAYFLSSVSEPASDVAFSVRIFSFPSSASHSIFWLFSGVLVFSRNVSWSLRYLVVDRASHRRWNVDSATCYVCAVTLFQPLRPLLFLLMQP